MSNSVSGSVALAFAAGLALSTQAFVNGRFGARIGSPELAAAVNQVVGFTTLTGAAIATGALARAWRRVCSGRWPRWWHVAANLSGALFIIVTVTAAPKVGVAVLTVALVSGQVIGGLLADRLALSPAGLRRLTPVRIISAGLALVAVAISAFGLHSHPYSGLLGLAFLAGAGFSIAQAAIGQVTRLTSEPLAAGSLNFGISGICVVGIALITTGGAPRFGWTAASPYEWIGGLIGAMIVLTVALTVRIIGVFRLTLSIVAGQTAAGVFFDLAAPVGGQRITFETIVAVILTLLAVGVSGVTRQNDAERSYSPAPPARGTMTSAACKQLRSRD